MTSFYGTNDDDTIYGNGLNNRIYGYGGNDILVGMTGNDRLYGGEGDDTLSGRRGSDSLWGEAGKDLLQGGADADMLVGGLGRDALVGGADGDSFQFHAITESIVSAPDVIRDFEVEEGDKIHLKLIDADVTLEGNQAFEYVGKSQFTGDAGELRLTGGGYEHRIEGDVNGDKIADFAVMVQGHIKFDHPFEDGGSFVL